MSLNVFIAKSATSLSIFYRLLKEDEKCGIRSVPKVAKGMVWEGSRYRRGQWPWLVAIKYYSKYICGGSLISKTLVISGKLQTF